MRVHDRIVGVLRCTAVCARVRARVRAVSACVRARARVRVCASCTDVHALVLRVHVCTMACTRCACLCACTVAVCCACADAWLARVHVSVWHARHAHCCAAVVLCLRLSCGRGCAIVSCRQPSRLRAGREQVERVRGRTCTCVCVAVRKSAHRAHPAVNIIVERPVASGNFRVPGDLGVGVGSIFPGGRADGLAAREASGASALSNHGQSIGDHTR